MKTEVKKVINEIQGQIDNLNNFRGNEVIWLNKTIGVIKLYFGPESPEYGFFNTFSFDKGEREIYNAHWDTTTINRNYDPADRYERIKLFLGECIKTLMQRDTIYVEPKPKDEVKISPVDNSQHVHFNGPVSGNPIVGKESSIRLEKVEPEKKKWWNKELFVSIAGPVIVVILSWLFWLLTTSHPKESKESKMPLKSTVQEKTSPHVKR